ncbi:pyridoxal-phosphate dependent enzyme [Pseudozobellia thermophila]|uniref:Threonine dehydratase n=1 Tax=Pseudozobellia thermophila TaxID=192903 RepID=A0A1M6CUJ1_9FLAO|nr:pyridoxal-phosphate dependent enzyme [Pseudozobellia thermophila]SHI64692.1 threonine dehydratase [Pseudozobellia thermophila]
MDKDTLLDCHRRISPHIHRTPVFSSRSLNRMAGADMVFKCENFQRGGSFKPRGAVNAILCLTEEQQEKGVVTHSSGNFAQALSLAAGRIGVQAYIVMPSNAPQVKKNAVMEYGGEIIECDPTLAARESEAARIVKETGATFIHPSNDMDVIVGQGTACLELLEEEQNLHYVVAPVGGGGLIAGTALAAYYFGKGCAVVGGEPIAVDDAYRSLKSGKIESNKTTDTIADGLKTQLGDKNFPILQKHVESIVRVTESEIIEAMRLIWERMKIVVEPSSAVALAAVLKEREKFENQKVGIILSGGNVDFRFKGRP